MYAIFATGGKQYKVTVNDLIDVQKLDMPVGETMEFNEVLLVATDDGDAKIGSPYVGDAAVLGQIIEHGKDKKIIVFKSKRRKGYKRKRGHRQQYTRLHITDIMHAGASLAEEEVKEVEAVAPEATEEVETQEQEEVELEAEEETIISEEEVEEVEAVAPEATEEVEAQEEVESETEEETIISEEEVEEIEAVAPEATEEAEAPEQEKVESEEEAIVSEETEESEDIEKKMEVTENGA